MANGHGGARPGAGRKSDAQIMKLRTLIATIMSDDDWIKFINGVVDDARSGDLRSISFLLALRYGVSTKSLVAAAEADLNPAPAEESDLNLAPAGTRPQVASAAVRKPEGIVPAGTRPQAVPPVPRIIHRVGNVK